MQTQEVGSVTYQVPDEDEAKLFMLKDEDSGDGPLWWTADEAAVPDDPASYLTAEYVAMGLDSEIERFDGEPSVVWYSRVQAEKIAASFGAELVEV